QDFAAPALDDQEQAVQNLNIDFEALEQINYLDGESEAVVGGGEEVNRLFIENQSQDTVFIMAGEVVKGGKQDRVIAQDMVIPPNSGPIDLSVFCVEKGRWHYGTTEAADFGGYGNFASMNVREAAVLETEQSAVWDSVAVVTNFNDATSSTSAYTALEASEDYQEELAHYIKEFSDLPEISPSVVGVVVVSGDKVIGCDMFATPALFKQSYPNLLHAYATQAITRGSDVTLKDAAVQDYLSEFLSDETKLEEALEGNGSVLEYNSKKVHISTFGK
ncbi:MAG: DUF6569 family protein, partial [Bacteroidota bacterium]